jgi:hypothetical protein
MFCGEGFSARGEVRLLGARIGGQLVMQGATLKGRKGSGGVVKALVADGIDVAGDVFLNDGFSAHGEVRLLGAHIGGQLGMPGATLNGKGGKGLALNADHLVVGESMFCGEGFSAHGEVRLLGARVGGQLSLKGAALEAVSESDDALSMIGATLDELILGPQRVTGVIDLRQASVRSLLDAGNGDFIGAQPDRLSLSGFTYRALRKPLTAKKRLERFEPPESDGYYPSVYVELANAYRRLGRGGDARAVAIAGERRAIQRMTKWSPRWLWNKLLWATTGCGYRNWLALLWLIGLVGIGSLLFWQFQSEFIPTLLIPPKFNPVLYTVDVTVPVLDVDQQKAWVATGWLRWVSLFLTIAGYALATAVVAAVAGLLNRDQR